MDRSTLNALGEVLRDLKSELQQADADILKQVEERLDDKAATHRRLLSQHKAITEWVEAVAIEKSQLLSERRHVEPYLKGLQQ